METGPFKPLRVAIPCLICGEEIEIHINDPKIQTVSNAKPLFWLCDILKIIRRSTKMRKLLRSMAKAKMQKMGYSKPNKRMGFGQWRKLVNAYPTQVDTGEKMNPNFHGKKRYEAGHRKHLFAY